MVIVNSKGIRTIITDIALCQALLKAAKKLAKHPKSTKALVQFKHTQFLPDVGRMRYIQKKEKLVSQQAMYQCDPYVVVCARQEVTEQLPMFTRLSASLDLLFFGPGSMRRKRKLSSDALIALVDEIATAVGI